MLGAALQGDQRGVGCLGGDLIAVVVAGDDAVGQGHGPEQQGDAGEAADDGSLDRGRAGRVVIGTGGVIGPVGHQQGSPSVGAR